VQKILAKVLFTTSLTLVASMAIAQDEPQRRAPGIIDRLFPDFKVPESHSLDKEKKKRLQEEPRLKRVSDAKTLIGKVKAVAFSGNTKLSDRKLRKITDPYLGKRLTKGTLAKIKYDIAKAYYDKGYTLVVVTTPPQQIKGGKLKVNILEAKVGKLNIRENEALRSWIAKAFTSRVREGRVFHEDTVTSMVSDINDLKNVRSSVTLKPGKKRGETDLDIVIRKASENNQNISTDNYGSPLTGKQVTSAHLEYGNLFKLGERASLDLRKSADELWSVSTSGSVPIGIRNIRLEGNYLRSANEIGGRLKAFDASGKTETAGAALSSMLLNTRDEKATIRVGFDAREHEAFTVGLRENKDNIRQGHISGSYLFRGARSVIYTAAKVSRGFDVFGASKEGQADATRATGNPDAWIFKPTFLANMRTSQKGSVKALVTGQMASDALLSSDLFVLGGYGSVRGFEVANQSGEAGYQFSVEYSHSIPIHNKWNLSVGPFVDGGSVFNRVDFSAPDDKIYSVGLGAELSTSLIPVGDTKLRMDWGHPIGGYQTSSNVDSDTFYFKLTQGF